MAQGQSHTSRYLQYCSTHSPALCSSKNASKGQAKQLSAISSISANKHSQVSAWKTHVYFQTSGWHDVVCMHGWTAHMQGAIVRPPLKLPKWGFLLWVRLKPQIKYHTATNPHHLEQLLKWLHHPCQVKLPSNRCCTFRNYGQINDM